MKNTNNQWTIDNGQLTMKEEIPSEFLENIFLHIVNYKSSIKYPEIDKVFKGWV
jgi:hypothetical protein